FVALAAGGRSPHYEAGRGAVAGRVRGATLVAAAEDLVHAGDRILCLTGVDRSGTLDTIMVLDMGTEIELFSAGAADPLRMAHAMRLAIEAGRLAAGAGRLPKKLYASASSPTQGLIGRN
ncbi:hypothetical protein HK102_012912, partial [Quaeritorhiza haematococci]